MNPNPRIVQVIAYPGIRGKGTSDDPCRGFYALYTLDGDLICEYDVTDEALTRVSPRGVQRVMGAPPNSPSWAWDGTTRIKDDFGVEIKQ